MPLKGKLATKIPLGLIWLWQLESWSKRNRKILLSSRSLWLSQ